MSVRLLFANVPVIAHSSRNFLSLQRSSFTYFGSKHFHSVCAAINYNCTHSQCLYTSLDARLLNPKPILLHRPSGIEGLVLHEYFSTLRSKKELRTSCYYYNSILRNGTESKYNYCTSNEKKESRSCGKGVDEEIPKKLTIVQRFKAMLKDYWHVLIPVHVITSIGWFGGFYYLATSGIDIPALMERLNFSESFVKPFRDSSMGYIAVAYGLYKIATPIRYTVTVGGTSIAIKFLKTRGLVQPWPIHFNWFKRTPRKKRTV